MRTDVLASHRSSIGWALLTAGGLIIALAGVMPSPVRGAATRGVRLAIRLPDAVAVAVAVLFALGALLFFARLWPRELWRRRKKGDEFELYHEPPAVSPWLVLALVLLMLLLLAVAAWFLWHGWSTAAHDARALPPSASFSRGGVSPEIMDKPGVSMTAFNVAVAVLGVVGGAAMLGLIVWLSFGDRLAWWWAGRIFGDVAQPLREAVAESLDELRAEPDARVAIIKCYRRFEQALARARVPRAPWETPTECMRTVLGRLALPREAVRLLTGLFELSRFSDRPLNARERDVACDCLAEIGTALEERRDAAAATA